MKPAIFSSHLFKDGAYESNLAAIQHASSIGIQGVEASCTDLEAYPLEEMQKHLNEYGMFVNSLNALTTFPAKEQAVYESELARIKSLIDRSERARLKFVMVIPQSDYVSCEEDKLFARERIVTGMTELIEYAKDASVTITMENFSFRKYPYSTIEEMQYLFQNIPGLKYTYDSGNFYCMQNDALLAYDTLKEHIVNVHMKDWVPNYYGRFVRPNMESFCGAGIGQGVLPLKELRARLNADGYDGQAAIEFNGVTVTPKLIEDSVNFIQGKC